MQHLGEYRFLLSSFRLSTFVTFENSERECMCVFTFTSFSLIFTAYITVKLFILILKMSF